MFHWWTSALVSHDSLYSLVYLSSLGGSNLSCVLPFLMGQEELLVFWSIQFLICYYGVVISKLLTFGTKNQKSFYPFLKYHFLINVKKLFFLMWVELLHSVLCGVCNHSAGRHRCQKLRTMRSVQFTCSQTEICAAVTLWRLRSLFSYCTAQMFSMS